MYTECIIYSELWQQVYYLNVTFQNPMDFYCQLGWVSSADLGDMPPTLGDLLRCLLFWGYHRLTLVLLLLKEQRTIFMITMLYFLDGPIRCVWFQVAKERSQNLPMRSSVPLLSSILTKVWYQKKLPCHILLIFNHVSYDIMWILYF